MAQAGGSRNKIIAVIIVLVLAAALVIPSLKTCGNKGTTENPVPPVPPPAPRVVPPPCSPDSAYASIQKQVDFGPRVPGTDAQTKCADWILQQCKKIGLTTELQPGSDTTWDGNVIPIKNIFAQYKPERNVRILLLAHWDSRPYADLDSVDQNKPILGADDGASGVAVLLEVARVLQTNDPNIGVDFFFSDAEDYGQKDGGMMAERDPDSWCLGTQYWAKHFKPTNYMPRFGILLDMVGGKHPVFPKEGTSMTFAPDIMNKVWEHARVAGYGTYFVDTPTGQTTDDHLYVNQLAGIRCIDIVHYEPSTHDYPEWHHKHSDNMNIIDKNTLKMVGDVVLETIFNEDPPKK
jgi:hypothetical protein